MEKEKIDFTWKISSDDCFERELTWNCHVNENEYTYSDIDRWADCWLAGWDFLEFIEYVAGKFDMNKEETPQATKKEEEGVSKEEIP